MSSRLSESSIFTFSTFPHFGTKMASKMEPKWSQNGSQTRSEAVLEASFVAPVFHIFFDRFWVPKLPKTSPNPDQTQTHFGAFLGPWRLQRALLHVEAVWEPSWSLFGTLLEHLFLFSMLLHVFFFAQLPVEDNSMGSPRQANRNLLREPGGPEGGCAVTPHGVLDYRV